MRERRNGRLVRRRDDGVRLRMREPAGAVAAHCRRFDPTGAIEPEDLALAGLMDLVGKNLKFYTQTGQITTDDSSRRSAPPMASPPRKR